MLLDISACISGYLLLRTNLFKWMPTNPAQRMGFWVLAIKKDIEPIS
jgi:hypothetical protein